MDADLDFLQKLIFAVIQIGVAVIILFIIVNLIFSVKSGFLENFEVKKLSEKSAVGQSFEKLSGGIISSFPITLHSSAHSLLHST